MADTHDNPTINVLRVLRDAQQGHIAIGQGDDEPRTVYALNPRQLAAYLDLTPERAMRVCNVLRNSGLIEYVKDAGDTQQISEHGLWLINSLRTGTTV